MLRSKPATVQQLSSVLWGWAGLARTHISRSAQGQGAGALIHQLEGLVTAPPGAGTPAPPSYEQGQWQEKASHESKAGAGS